MTDAKFDKVSADNPDGLAIRVRRGFAAPLAAVWRALTDAAAVNRWLLGPPGWEMAVCEMDVRVGGKFHWRWCTGIAGEEFGLHGEFLDVDAPARLVKTEDFDSDARVGQGMSARTITIELSEEIDGRTLMTVLIRFADKPTRDSFVDGVVADGMEKGFARLDELLPEVGEDFDANASLG